MISIYMYSGNVLFIHTCCHIIGWSLYITMGVVAKMTWCVCVLQININYDASNLFLMDKRIKIINVAILVYGRSLMLNLLGGGTKPQNTGNTELHLLFYITLLIHWRKALFWIPSWSNHPTNDNMTKHNHFDCTFSLQ
jgi:hypothetical protein